MKGKDDHCARVDLFTVLLLYGKVKEFSLFKIGTFAGSGLSGSSKPHEIRLFSSLPHCGYDLGTEELAHFEMVAAMVHQLTRKMSQEEIMNSGFANYFVDHTAAIYPLAASGTPWRAEYIQSKGDVITDLHEDLAAEQKARTTYDNILSLIDDPDIRDPIKFLRAREIVHYQRFGEGLRVATDKLDSKNYYAYNPSFIMDRK